MSKNMGPFSSKGMWRTLNRIIMFWRRELGQFPGVLPGVYIYGARIWEEAVLTKLNSPWLHCGSGVVWQGSGERSWVSLEPHLLCCIDKSVQGLKVGVVDYRERGQNRENQRNRARWTTQKQPSWELKCFWFVPSLLLQFIIFHMDPVRG